MSYLDHLEKVSTGDVASLREAQASYGNSWMKRGGVGAFMMLARKWDRIENQLSEASPQWDIFKSALDSPEDGIIDDIRDLRCYLMLVEAQVIEMSHADQSV